MRALFLAFLLLASPVFAVEPDEVLSDPVMEERARDISKGLRCLVCQNESIDESDAALAKDLRLFVRELLVEGQTDAEVLDSIVARYGEYVLLSPRLSAKTLVLYLSGPVLLIFGGILVWRTSRKTAPKDPPPPLSKDEQERLKDITGA